MLDIGLISYGVENIRKKNYTILHVWNAQLCFWALGIVWHVLFELACRWMERQQGLVLVQRDKLTTFHSISSPICHYTLYISSFGA